MDLVITYVDNNNKDWINNYKNQSEESYPMYFRTHYDVLKYILRGVEFCLPYIENVFIIVQNKSEIPNYIDTDKVIIIEHKDIIPKQFLPCFNSCTIEWFIANIPNLNDEFLYLNDDMFLMHPIAQEQFYNNKFEIAPPNHPFTTGILLNCAKMIYKNDFPMAYLPRHTIRYYNKNAMKLCYQEFQMTLENSFTTFRDNETNISIYALDMYMDKNGWYREGKVSSYKFISNKEIYNYDVTSIIYPINYNCLCISDACLTPDIYIDTNILQIFAVKYPNISKYERGETK